MSQLVQRVLAIVLLIGLSIINVKCDYPIVQIKQGLVRGTIEQAANGRNYSSFRGIPYATPPLGELRFQAPLAADSWDGVLNATNDAPKCTQFSNRTVGSEDCLKMNVYTPYLSNSTFTSLLPVIVFIHEGGFTIGEAASYSHGAQRFMQKDIVLVLMAYRLGVFGFLSTGDSASSGNYGLLDQVLALNWVQENIAAFGGDPALVTIDGESAGSASVSFHLLSPLSKGLFRAAISESGSSLCPWALQSQPLLLASEIAQLVNCPTLNSQEIVNCLRTKTSDELTVAMEKMAGYSNITYDFVPVVENKDSGKFLTELPLEILYSGNFNKVPVITGVNKDEGDLIYGPNEAYYQVIDANFFDNTLPRLIFYLTHYDRNLVNVSYAVKAEYYDVIDITNASQVARASIDVNSDPVFKAPTDLTIRLLTSAGVPTYMYAFEFPGSGSTHNYTGEIEISHTDELYYLFNMKSFNENDQYISNALIEMWTNFATNLNPTPEGVPVQWNPTPLEEDLEYLRIGYNLTIEKGYLTDKMFFWNNKVPSIVYG